MPREHEMKYLYEVTVEAISRYSEDHASAYWFINIENTVLKNVLENDPYSLSYFRAHELTVMRELIHRGLWVKWCSENCRPVLSPDPIVKYNGFDDTVPTPSGAD